MKHWLLSIALTCFGSNAFATGGNVQGTPTGQAKAGTSNVVAKYQSNGQLGNSGVTDNGTTVSLSENLTLNAGATLTNNGAVPVGISSVTFVSVNDSTATSTFTGGCFLNGAMSGVAGSSVTITLAGTQKVRVKISGEETNSTAAALDKFNVLQNGQFPSPFTASIPFASREVTLTGTSDPQTIHKEWVFNPGVGTWTYCLEGATSAGAMSFPNGTFQFSAEIVQ